MTVLTLGGKPIDWEDKRLDPKMLVQWKPDHGSIPKQYKASLRTCAHQDYMDLRAFRRYGTGIAVIQTPYNTGVPASAGTHDYDCMRDWWIPGVAWWETQRFGRALGEFVWYRHPPLFGNHCHGGTLPIPEGNVRSDDFATRVGIYVPGQLVDYYNHAFGLSGKHTPGSDKSWFPKDIDSTVFDLKHYINIQREKDMEYSDWSPKSKQEFARDISASILGAKVNVMKPNGDGKQQITVKQAIARGANGAAVTRNARDDVIAAVEAADTENA